MVERDKKGGEGRGGGTSVASSVEKKVSQSDCLETVLFQSPAYESLAANAANPGERGHRRLGSRRSSEDKAQRSLQAHPHAQVPRLLGQHPSLKVCQVRKLKVIDGTLE